MSLTYRIQSARAPYRRAGLAFGAARVWVEVAFEELGAERLIRLLADDVLRLEISDEAGETWTPADPELRARAKEIVASGQFPADPEPAPGPPPVDPLSTDRPPAQTGVDGDAGAASVAPAELDAPDTSEAQNAPIEEPAPGAEPEPPPPEAPEPDSAPARSARSKAPKAPADPPADPPSADPQP